MAQPQVAINDRRDGPFIATAGQDVFPYTFPVELAGEITVTQVTKIGGAISTPAFATVIGAEGGTITLNTPAALDDEITIEGDRSLVRTSNYIPGGRFPAIDLNFDFNRITKSLQELRRDADNSAALRPETANGVSPILPAPLAGSAIGWNSAGLGLTNYATSDIFGIDVSGVTLYDHLEFNGSEWAAISGATFAGNVIPSGVFTLGNGSSRWSELWLSGNANVGGDLYVTDDTTLGGSLDVGGNADIGGFTGASSGANNLVLSEDSATVGLSILSATGGETKLFFGDDVDSADGTVTYSMTSHRFLFNTNNLLAMRINADQSLQAEHDFLVLEDTELRGDLDVSGSVGVGTTDPKEALGVVGDITLQSKNQAVMFNLYWDSGWKHADANGSLGYGGYILSKQDGGLDFKTASSVGAADDAAASFSATTHMSSAGNWTFGGNVDIGGDLEVSGALHVGYDATSPPTNAINGGADNLVIGDLTGNNGLTILVADNGTGHIVIGGDDADSDEGRITYKLDTEVMTIITDGSAAININGTQDVEIARGDLTVTDGDLDVSGNLVVGTDTILDTEWTDYENHVFVSGANARFIGQGTSSAALVLIDSGATEHQKVFAIKTDNQVTTFKADKDDGYLQQLFLSFNHSNGEITPNLSSSGTSGCLIVVGGFVKIAES